MHQEIIKKLKPELDNVIIFLDREIAKIRGARASTALVEDITIDYHGEKLPLKKVASISLSGPRVIAIHPWDKSVLLSIERTILGSDLGINPVLKGDFIEVPLPPPSEEFRKELLRFLSEKLEMARQSIRHWREEAWRQIQEGFRQGKVREDDKFRAKDELQKLMDEYNEKIEERGESKKKEIME